MIEKRTIVDQVEVTRDGVLQVRFRKEIVEDDKVLMFEYHRVAMAPDSDIPGLVNAVNGHLDQMGYGRPSDEEWKRMHDLVPVVHTPRAKQNWAKKMADIEAERKKNG